VGVPPVLGVEGAAGVDPIVTAGEGGLRGLSDGDGAVAEEGFTGAGGADDGLAVTEVG
jgi:hypothetical protein